MFSSIDVLYPRTKQSSLSIYTCPLYACICVGVYFVVIIPKKQKGTESNRKPDDMQGILLILF